MQFMETALKSHYGLIYGSVIWGNSKISRPEDPPPPVSAAG